MVKPLMDDQGSRPKFVVKTAPEDNLEVALQLAWSNGDCYVLYE